MAKKTYWCRFKHLPTEKSVIYSSDSYKDKNPFKCIICHKRYSHKDLGLVRKKNVTMYQAENPERLKQLCKDLREHCKTLMKEKGIPYIKRSKREETC